MFFGVICFIGERSQAQNIYKAKGGNFHELNK
ncbi:hypothetical protein MGA3_16016 [Bacillus methanolicus MGA3]|nr:hypothetical protein MGA3_16016 [Bacillus methanolicus MGA3]